MRAGLGTDYVEFEDARQPGLMHCFYRGATGFAEALARWNAGHRRLDKIEAAALGQIERSEKRAPARDYLAPRRDWWRL